jgi:hypothetical protein
MTNVLRLTLLIVAAFASSASAADMTVFGIPLDEQLSLRPCERGEIVKKSTCYTTFFGVENGSYGMEVATIWLTTEQQMQNHENGFTVANPTAVLIDGSLEHVLLSTRGDVGSQESMLRLLTKKYGKPQHILRRTLRNAFGATFPSIAAKWQFPDLIVEFDGGTTVTEASVEISTTRYIAIEAKRDAAIKQKTTPF